MTNIQKRLVNAYATLVMGQTYITKEEDRSNESQTLVPNTTWNLNDGTTTTLRFQVEMEVAMREIAILG